MTNPSYCRARAGAWEGPGFSVVQTAPVSNQGLKRVRLPNAKQTETLRHRPPHAHLPSPHSHGPARSSWASLVGDRFHREGMAAFSPRHPKAPALSTRCLSDAAFALNARCSPAVSPRRGQELGYRRASPAGCGQGDQCPERAGQDRALPGTAAPH